MAVDPLAKLAKADARFKRTRLEHEAATAARREAIIAAHEAGVTLVDIANHLDVNHETVRLVIRAHDNTLRPYQKKKAPRKKATVA